MSPALSHRTLHWGLGLALFALGFALYAEALGYELLDWDDQVYVVGNPFLRGLTPENLWALCSRPFIGGILPVHMLSYAFDYAIWELDPSGYHLHSLLLNALNGALGFALLLRLTRSPVAAAAGALLFVVHPSHVSSAVWVSARKELLWTAFLLGSALAYLRARREGGALDRRFYALSLVCFGLGVLSKTTIVFYPLFFLVVDHFEDTRLAPERRRSPWGHLLNKLPYLAIALPVVALNLWAQTPATDPWARDLGTSVLLKGGAAWRYLQVLIGLHPGQPIYDLPAAVYGDPLGASLTVLPLLLTPALLALALWRGWAQVSMALAFAVAGMLPPIAFPLITYMADRYLYAPSLGLCWLVGVGIAAAARWIAPVGWRQAAAAALLVALPAWQFAALTRAYTPVWRDSMALWSYADRFSDATRVATGLSAALIRAGSPGEAVRVIEATPVRDARTELHLAIALLSLGRLDEANQASSRALILVRQGEVLETSALLRLLWIHGEVLAQMGRVDEAEHNWRLALQVDPDFGPVLASLAALAGRDAGSAPPESEVPAPE